MEGMQVLSLGMSRTGTASMKEALRILGHDRVHHAYELYSHPDQCRQWLAAWDAKAKGLGETLDRNYWNNILAGYTAVTDMPAVCFAKELIDAYPEAKVVLIQREEEAWLRSFKSAVIDTYFDNSLITASISLFDRELMRPLHFLWSRLLAARDGFFEGTTKSQVEQNALEVYRKHNALIIAHTPPENLLLFNLEDGWKPLCAFLGMEIPQVPFPNVNEGDAVKDVVAAFTQKSMIRAVRNLFIIGVSCAAAFYLCA
ncbi:hypothetical protein N7509_014247 [Penicillium cosmopolitanum]|uniref:NAD dependent epimerase/dehydratase n=1 Tax=Penicillium cosmopolitanum TaxID=1131564 RepID=A0A9W9S0G1_9EURO|nr:uncharacterized protein N7509_014247 [Penicillium cosmopolitanum]KAJ5369635.1 hypothetical protein N7509_014247 [Penicillium cosmopolitanum]